MSDDGITSEAFERLNPREQAFVVGYSGHANGTRAALEAGYAKSGAHVQASRLLKRANIQAAIREQKQAQFRRMHMGADELLALIAGQARGMMGEVLHITPDGDPYIDLNKASPEFMSNVVEAVIEDFTDGREVDDEGKVIKRDVRRVKVKLASQDAARNTLAKHLGLLIDKSEVTVSGNFAEVMAAAQQSGLSKIGFVTDPQPEKKP